jgi:CheY-like chemotaxis protein
MQRKAKLKILLVDDNNEFLKIIEKVLQTYFSSMIGIIDKASNGQECIDMVRKNSYDVILMDLEMPVMNGLEATKYLSENFPDIKIIALSSKHELNDIQKMNEAGAMDYIIKEKLTKEYLGEILTRL